MSNVHAKRYRCHEGTVPCRASQYFAVPRAARRMLDTTRDAARSIQIDRPCVLPFLGDYRTPGGARGGARPPRWVRPRRVMR